MNPLVGSSQILLKSLSLIWSEQSTETVFRVHSRREEERGERRAARAEKSEPSRGEGGWSDGLVPPLPRRREKGTRGRKFMC